MLSEGLDICSAMNVELNIFKQVRVNDGSKFDSLKFDGVAHAWITNKIECNQTESLRGFWPHVSGPPNRAVFGVFRNFAGHY